MRVLFLQSVPTRRALKLTVGLRSAQPEAEVGLISPAPPEDDAFDTSWKLGDARETLLEALTERSKVLRS